MKKSISLSLFIVGFAATTFAQAVDTLTATADTLLQAAAPVAVQAQDIEGIAGAWATVISFYPAALHYAQLYLPILFAILIAVKLTVKAIPTPYAIKVAGRLDCVLNFLTFFKKDVRSLSVALFFGLSFMLCSCSTIQAVAKDCTVSTPVLTAKTQKIVIECNNLPADIMEKVRTELSKYIGQ